jgi:hypothetical protein
MPDEPERSLEEEEDITDLPEREAMSLLPTSLIGGLGSASPLGGGSTDPTSSGTSLGGGLLGGGSTAPADPSQVPTADPSTAAPSAPAISVPQMPVPTANPGGTYTPDATSTSSSST